MFGLCIRYTCAKDFWSVFDNSYKILLISNRVLFLPTYLFRVYDFCCLHKIYILVHKITYKIFDLYLIFIIRYFGLCFILLTIFCVFNIYDCNFWSLLNTSLFLGVQGVLGWLWTLFGVAKYSLCLLFFSVCFPFVIFVVFFYCWLHLLLLLFFLFFNCYGS
jgi:hypothetical protein